VRRHKVEAVIGFNNSFLWGLAEGGIRVPEEVGFASLHLDFEVAELLGDELIESGMREIGESR
jgi:hypothetical protein